jgi:8-oxo-dGTP pyrophosphatase MutT (NUDIX family)/predicted amidohydrolase
MNDNAPVHGTRPPHRQAGARAPRSEVPPAAPSDGCGPCVARLTSPRERVRALREVIAVEAEPVVALTHLLQVCRDEHHLLWEAANDPESRRRVGALMAALPHTAGREGGASIPAALRGAMAEVLAAGADQPTGPTVLAVRELAELIDARYHHTFPDWFRRRSPYQPAVGDPMPLDSPDLRNLTVLPVTAPPWRLANRLDETRHLRLAGSWAVQFRVIFDYSVHESLAGLIHPGTVIATCHPNGSLQEFDLPRSNAGFVFPVHPVDLVRQRGVLDRQIRTATGAGASIVVLPELSVSASLAMDLQDWVRRPDGPRLLVAGSYHHRDADAGGGPLRRRNTAVAWVRGHEAPMTQDKYSPAEAPLPEGLQPPGWPELKVYVSADGWHVVIAICRDLLNPHAVHALAEAGANLVLVPAMSETLTPFGGPAAQLVAHSQALVAIANNPGDWGNPGSGASAGRALFGHPGLARQTRLAGARAHQPGVALHTVRDGATSWIPDPSREPSAGPHLPRKTPPKIPVWAQNLAARLTPPPPPAPLASPAHSPPAHSPAAHSLVALRPAAVLILLTGAAENLSVLLVQRSEDLTDYPGEFVFPGGAVEPGDTDPIATAFREAREEAGIDPVGVDVLGLLPSFGLPETGFLVHPVLAWSNTWLPGRPNPGEVTTVRYVRLSDLRLGGRYRPFPTQSAAMGSEVVDPDEQSGPVDRAVGGFGAPGADADVDGNGAGVGRLTLTLIDLISSLVP